MTESSNKFIRRKKDHDYKSPCHYHIILRKHMEFPFWGHVAGDPDIPLGKPGEAQIEKTLEGKIIGSHIFNFPKKHPFIHIKRYKVMPDHVHIFLQVRERMQKALGYYINGLKFEIAEEISLKLNKKLLPLDIFEENFRDIIVYIGHDFSIINNYIDDNPRRLAFRFKYPLWFEKRDVMIDGVLYEGYGNHFLLDNPFKFHVREHLRSTPEERQELLELSLEHVDSGGILISTFINNTEKSIRDITKAIGGKMIRIQDKPFGLKYKPSQDEFYQCSRGQLLILAPKDKPFAMGFREACKEMNALAKKIADKQYLQS